MIYRRTRAADRIQIREMYEAQGIEYDLREPLVGFVAESNQDGTSGKLLGFSYLHTVALIEPFVCVEPLAAIKLFYMTEGALNMIPNVSSVIVHIREDNKKLVDELSRLGFGRTQTGFTVFRKVI